MTAQNFCEMSCRHLLPWAMPTCILLMDLFTFIRKAHLSYSLTVFGRLSQKVISVTGSLYLFAFILVKDGYFFLQLTQANQSKHSLHSKE